MVVFRVQPLVAGGRERKGAEVVETRVLGSKILSDYRHVSISQVTKKSGWYSVERARSAEAKKHDTSEYSNFWN